MGGMGVVLLAFLAWVLGSRARRGCRGRQASLRARGYEAATGEGLSEKRGRGEGQKWLKGPLGGGRAGKARLAQKYGTDV